MKYWIITFLASVTWAGVVLGIMYLHTHAQNDALDAAYGQISGIGFVGTWAFSIFWRWKKRTPTDKSS